MLLVVSCVYPPEPVVSARLSADIYKAIKESGNIVKVLHPIATRPNGYSFGDIKLSEDEIVPTTYTCPESSLIGRFRESISLGLATYKFIKQNKNDIEAIYANTWPLFAQFFLAKAACKNHVRYYIHIQDIYPESYCFKMPMALGKILLRVLLPLDKYILRKATGIIGISPAMIEYLSKTRHVEQSKFTLVRNWQDDELYIDSFKPIIRSSSKCHIMYLGSINPTANVTLIIKACAKLDKTLYSLSIIGNGPERDNCEMLAKQIDVEAAFGTVTPDIVAEKQSNSDVLVLCLKKGVARTATPSKLTAYMLTGRPIIASVDTDSDCANIINEAKCGIVVEPDNVEALSIALEQIANKNIEDLNKMGRSAFEYAMRHLSKKRNLQIITNLLANND